MNQSGIGRIVRDVIDLCELQVQLLSVDSQEAKRKLTKAGIFGAIAITLSGSALTTLMVGGGFLLHDVLEWSTGASLLAVAGGVFAIVIVFLLLALRAASTASAALAETKSEFAENLKWIKAVVVAPETSARNQIREESFPRAANAGDRFTNSPRYPQRQ